MDAARPTLTSGLTIRRAVITATVAEIRTATVAAHAVRSSAASRVCGDIAVTAGVTAAAVPDHAVVKPVRLATVVAVVVRALRKCRNGLSLRRLKPRDPDASPTLFRSSNCRGETSDQAISASADEADLSSKEFRSGRNASAQ